MYPLLRWKMLTSLLAVVIACAVYADDFGTWLGVDVPDYVLIRFFPALLFALLSVVFGPTSYWAPWRILWRCFPGLNKWFPDLNGVWVGSTLSNWPTVEKLFEAAQSSDKATEQELHDFPEQRDAIAVQITNSVFALRINAFLSSTDAESHSIAAKPWRNQHCGEIHLSYVYKQRTPNPALSDEEAHLGAGDLVITGDNYSSARGTYWTRRGWKTGRNTAGMLELTRLTHAIEKERTLREHAAEYKPSPGSPSE